MLYFTIPKFKEFVVKKKKLIDRPNYYPRPEKLALDEVEYHKVSNSMPDGYISEIIPLEPPLRLN